MYPSRPATVVVQALLCVRHHCNRLRVLLPGLTDKAPRDAIDALTSGMIDLGRDLSWLPGVGRSGAAGIVAQACLDVYQAFIRDLELGIPVGISIDQCADRFCYDVMLKIELLLCKCRSLELIRMADNPYLLTVRDDSVMAMVIVCLMIEQIATELDREMRQAAETYRLTGGRPVRPVCLMRLKRRLAQYLPTIKDETPGMAANAAKTAFKRVLYLASLRFGSPDLVEELPVGSVAESGILWFRDSLMSQIGYAVSGVAL